MEFLALSEQFCDEARYLRGFSPETIRRYRGALGLLRRRAGLERLEDYTEERIREFFYRGRKEYRWSTSTFVSYHKSLVVFFRWCVSRGLLATSPVDGIETPRIEKRLPARLSAADAQRLLDCVLNCPYPYRFLRYRNHALLAMALFAGLRKSELLHLQLHDLDLEHRSLFVRQGKGQKDRIVPLSATLVPILGRYLEERARLRKSCPEVFTSLNRDLALTSEGIKGIVLSARRVSGLEFHLHTLRHSFATLMLEGGCDLFALSKMMGHSDIKTTTIYLAASAEHLRAQITKHPLNYPAAGFSPRTWR
jgi:site-specific recombinase XerD